MRREPERPRKALTDIRTQFLQLLINVFSLDLDGSTPLHVVCAWREGANLAAKLLLQFNADPNLHGKDLRMNYRF